MFKSLINCRLVEYLIGQGASDLSNALTAAAEGGKLNIIEYLFNRGFRPVINTLNQAFIGAAAGGYIEVIEYFCWLPACTPL